MSMVDIRGCEKLLRAATAVESLRMQFPHITLTGPQPFRVAINRDSLMSSKNSSRRKKSRRPRNSVSVQPDLSSSSSPTSAAFRAVAAAVDSDVGRPVTINTHGQSYMLPPRPTIRDVLVGSGSHPQLLAPARLAEVLVINDGVVKDLATTVAPGSGIWVVREKTITGPELCRFLAPNDLVHLEHHM